MSATTRSVDELMTALQKIMDDAEARGGDLTDEEIATYESTEKELLKVRRSDEIAKRHEAYKSVNPSLLVTGTSPKVDDTLERAFEHYLRTGRPNADITELRSQSHSNTEGGYTVPDGFRQKLVERRKAFGGIASVVENITTSDGNSLEWPTLDDTSNQGAITAENASFGTGADLVFGTKALGAFKYTSNGADADAGLRVPVELLQDSAFDIAGLVARKLGERIARKQADHWVNGTGAGSQPDGIYEKAPVVAQIPSSTLDYDGLLDVVHALDPEYRTGARWAFNDQTLRDFRGLVDTTGRPLLQQLSTSQVSGDPGGLVLLGYPVTVDQAFGNGEAVFGRLAEAYVIRRVAALTVVVNPYSRASYGQVEYTAWERASGTIQNDWAYKTTIFNTPGGSI